MRSAAADTIIAGTQGVSFCAEQQCSVNPYHSRTPKHLGEYCFRFWVVCCQIEKKSLEGMIPRISLALLDTPEAGSSCSSGSVEIFILGIPAPDEGTLCNLYSWTTWKLIPGFLNLISNCQFNTLHAISIITSIVVEKIPGQVRYWLQHTTGMSMEDSCEFRTEALTVQRQIVFIACFDYIAILETLTLREVFAQLCGSVTWRTEVTDIQY